MPLKPKTLILDLDHTVVVIEEEKDKIHPSHTLSELIEIELFISPGVLQKKRAYIINPDKIAALIQKAYDEGGDVIILTSGFWANSIRYVLASQLTLSSNAILQLSNCGYYSPIEEGALWRTDPRLIRHTLKGIRFMGLLSKYPEWSSRSFVVLDNSQIQILSFQTIKGVNAILATTDRSSLDFYSVAMDFLTLQREESNYSYSLTLFEQQLFLEPQTIPTEHTELNFS